MASSVPQAMRRQALLSTIVTLSTATQVTKRKTTPNPVPAKKPEPKAEPEPEFKHPHGHLMAGTPVMKILKHR